MLVRHRPWAVVNAAGFVRVDDAEREMSDCVRENTLGPATLAGLCASHGVALLTFSSDLVFDGTGRRRYVESDAVNPLGVYGRSKAKAERLVAGCLSSALIIRTSAFFGPRDEHNFVTRALRELSSGQFVHAADDAVVSPTYVPDLVHAALDLLIDGESGIWHLANAGDISWAALARRAAALAGLDPALVIGVPTAALGLAAPRPAFSALGSERGNLMPSLDSALGRYIAATTASAERDMAGVS